MCFSTAAERRRLMPGRHTVWTRTWVMRERKRETVRDKKKLLWGNMLRTTSAIPPREKSNSTAILSSCPPTCIPTPSCSPVTATWRPTVAPSPHPLTHTFTNTHSCMSCASEASHQCSVCPVSQWLSIALVAHGKSQQPGWVCFCAYVRACMWKEGRVRWS